MSQPTPSDLDDGNDEYSERGFFLAEFRGTTLIIALPPGEDADSLRAFERVVRELLTDRARVLVVVPDDESDRTLRDVVSSLGPPLSLVGETVGLDDLAAVWSALRERRGAVLVANGRKWAEVASLAATVAARLGAHKLVLADPEGGFGSPRVSFIDADELAATVHVGTGRERSALLAAIRAALAGGVTSVNVCRLAEIEAELFTYDGAGTLVTGESYLSVGPLRVDDFPAVERLLERGVREGFLRPRGPEEITRLLLTGYGARIASSGHLAGVVALEEERYRGDGLGEVVGLYTINRFTGEGVGATLLDHLLIDAEQRGLRGVFACTTSERAAAFFERHGFTEVEHDQLPAAKWHDYDGTRKTSVRALLRLFSVNGS
jgi:amino-acid N-acetyltransferase